MPLAPRTVLLAILPFALLGAGLMWPKPDRYDDGKAALANVGRLRKGMTFNQAAETLHPERMRRSSAASYSVVATSDGGSEQVHALTADRYLVSRWKPRRGPTEPALLSWRIESGRAPREDVDLDPGIHIGPFRVAP